MRKILISLAATAMATAFGLSVYGQQAPPPGVGDKDLRDNNIRMRSVELERVDRDARKGDKKEDKKKKNKPDQNSATVQNAPEPPKDVLTEIYPQIKEDYESIQNSQAAIMTAYGDGKNLDYAKINGLSTEINKNALRLNANLFPVSTDAAAPTAPANKQPEPEKVVASKSLRSLLIEMDEAVANIIVSPLFQNLRNSEPAAAEKTKADLQSVIKLSEAVKNEAARLQK